MRFQIFAFGISAVLAIGGCGGSSFSSSANGAGGSSNTGGASAGGTSSTGGAAGSTSTGGRVGTGGISGGGGVVAGGGSGGGVTTTSWCDSHTGAVLCEDFDSWSSVDAFLSSWSSSSQINGTFSFNDGFSPPNALRVQSTSTTDVQTMASKVLNLSSPPVSLRLGFDLRIDAANGISLGSGVLFAAIILGSDIANGVIALEIAPCHTLNCAGYELYTVWYKPPADGGTLGLGSQYVSALPTLGQWAGRYAIEIQYSTAADAASDACVQMYAGDVPQGSCAQLSPSMRSPSSVFSVGLGIKSAAVLGTPTTGNIDLSFDNILVTKK